MPKKIPKTDSTSGNNPKQVRSMLELALWYASEGVAVFPLKPKDKTPLIGAWQKKATCDETRIRDWWTQHPQANIGGHPGANQVVLDVDGVDHGGDDGFESVEGYDLPETFKCYTGNGGEHHWFTLPDDGEEYKTTQTGALPGVDLRGAKGYVVLPGSIHPNGQPYLLDVDGEKVDPRPLGELPALRGISVAPGWLLDLCRGTSTDEPLKDRGKATEGIFRASLRAGLVAKYKDEAQVGNRNNTLFRYACEARRHELDMEQDWVRVGQEVGLDAGEVRAVLRSAAQAEPMGAASHEREIARELERLQVREEANRRLRAGRAPDPTTLARPGTMADLLKMDLGEPGYLVENLWPENGRVVLTAAKKTGKTTMVGNVLRSLLDGGSFLGNFPVKPGNKVYLIDNEMNSKALQKWYREFDAQHYENLFVECLRENREYGRRVFNPLDETNRAVWAERIAATGANVVVLDCLRPQMDALGLDENHEAGLFLDAMDALIQQAGVPHLLVVHHSGHLEGRARGDSRIGDWPDAEWKLNKKTEQGTRSFQAYGRDVSVPAQALKYTAENRLLELDPDALRMEEAARDEEKRAAQAALEEKRLKKLRSALEADPGLSVRKAQKLLSGTELRARTDEVSRLLKLIREGDSEAA